MPGGVRSTRNEDGMRLMITGRHVAVTPALREYVETRMERLDRYGLKLGTLQILLSLEKFHHVAEVVGVVQGRRLQAKTSTEEMYASIDEVVDKLGAAIAKTERAASEPQIRRSAACACVGTQDFESGPKRGRNCPSNVGGDECRRCRERASCHAAECAHVHECRVGERPGSPTCCPVEKCL